MNMSKFFINNHQIVLHLPPFIEEGLIVLWDDSAIISKRSLSVSHGMFKKEDGISVETDSNIFAGKVSQ
jgi:hypothetical protein